MRALLIKAAAVALGFSALLAGPAMAHGARMTVSGVDAVEVVARFDSGAPMADAQITVYAPDDAAVPWTTGVADETGRFVFVPDGRQGRWAIEARLAGHGTMGYFEFESGRAGAVLVPESAADPALWQRLLMIACIVWGCIGTVLYFRRSRQKEAA